MLQPAQLYQEKLQEENIKRRGSRRIEVKQESEVKQHEV